MGWGPAVLSGLICWTVAGRREAGLKEHAMRTSQKAAGIITTIGIDIGKNTFHLVGLDKRDAIALAGCHSAAMKPELSARTCAACDGAGVMSASITRAP